MTMKKRSLHLMARLGASMSKGGIIPLYNLDVLPVSQLT